MRRNKEKTVCSRGHPFAGENLYVDNAGKRHCKICERGHMRLRAGWPEDLAFTLPPQPLGKRPSPLGRGWKAAHMQKAPKPTPVERFMKFVKIQPGCWEWIGPVNETGYGRFFLNGKNRKAPRVAYELMVGPIPPSDYSIHGTMIMHTCDNPKCVNPAHLRLGDAGLNMTDALLKGRLRGPAQILTLDRARAIKARLAEGAKKVAVAKEFGVSAACVRGIADGRTWRHV